VRQRFKSDSISNSNRFKPSSNCFKLRPIQNGLPELQKFGIKYGCEGLEESNKFVHRNFIRLKSNFELKIWEVKVCFEFRKLIKISNYGPKIQEFA
jgi:hypothetical protein